MTPNNGKHMHDHLFIATTNDSYLTRVQWVAQHFVFTTPLCPRCENDESMLCILSLWETVNQNETHYYRVFKCQDCGACAAIGFRQLTIDMFKHTMGM